MENLTRSVSQNFFSNEKRIQILIICYFFLKIRLSSLISSQTIVNIEKLQKLQIVDLRLIAEYNKTTVQWSDYKRQRFEGLLNRPSTQHA